MESPNRVKILAVVITMEIHIDTTIYLHYDRIHIKLVPGTSVVAMDRNETKNAPAFVRRVVWTGIQGYLEKISGGLLVFPVALG